MRVEGDAHMRAAARPVEEGDLAEMLLDDLLHDREAEARAAHARRHVRLGQPLPLFRKADAGVHDVDDQLAIVLADLQVDAIAGEVVLSPAPPRLDRLDGVLDDVAERLPKLSTVGDHVEGALRRLKSEADAGMRDLVKEQRLASNLVNIFVPEDGLRHAREIGELIDHSAEVADLADDGSGQPLERLCVGRDLLAEAPLEPFGGKLDRS